MARTVAGGRPGARRYTPDDAVVALCKWFDRDRAIRVVAIAQAFGAKAESCPGGFIMVRVAGDRVTIEEHTG